MNIQPTVSTCSFSHLSARNLHGMKFESGAESLFVKKRPRNSYFQNAISDIREFAAIQTKQFIDFWAGRRDDYYAEVKNPETDSSKMNSGFELFA